MHFLKKMSIFETMVTAKKLQDKVLVGCVSFLGRDCLISIR